MSRLEPTDADRGLADRGPTAPSAEEAIDTGDLVIDAALRDLAAVDPVDLDGHIDAAESLQRTLQARLANLGE